MFFKSMVLATGGTLLIVVSDLLLRATESTFLGITTHAATADLGLLVGIAVDLVAVGYLVAIVVTWYRNPTARRPVDSHTSPPGF